MQESIKESQSNLNIQELDQTAAGILARYSNESGARMLSMHREWVKRELKKMQAVTIPLGYLYLVTEDWQDTEGEELHYQYSVNKKWL